MTIYDATTITAWRLSLLTMAEVHSFKAPEHVDITRSSPTAESISPLWVASSGDMKSFQELSQRVCDGTPLRSLPLPSFQPMPLPRTLRITPLDYLFDGLLIKVIGYRDRVMVTLAHFDPVSLLFGIEQIRHHTKLNGLGILVEREVFLHGVLPKPPTAAR